MLDTGAALSIIHRSVVDQMKKKISWQDWKMIKFSNKNLPEVFGVEGSGIKVLFSMTIPISREFRKTEWAKIFVVDVKMRTKIIFGVATMKKLGLMIYDSRTGDIVPLSYDHDAIPQERQGKVEFPEEQEEKRLNTVAVDLFDSRGRGKGIKARRTTTLKPNSTRLIRAKVGTEAEGKSIFLDTSFIRDPEVRCSPMVADVKNRCCYIAVTNTSSEEKVLDSRYTLAHWEEVDSIIPLKKVYEPENFKAIVNQINTHYQERNEKIMRTDLDRWNVINGFVDTNSGTMTQEETRRLKELIQEFQHLFALGNEDLSQTHLIEHTIDVEGYVPIKSKPRQPPHHLKSKVDEMVKSFLDNNIARHSSSPWASPVVMVRKKYGTMRFCVDYRNLNSITKKNAFPLPHINNTLMNLGKKRYFSSLDMFSGYYQISMEKKAIEKTAFVTTAGLYEFTVMPFGLANAVPTYQRFMTRLLDGVLNDFAYVYIDDILVASEPFEEHLEHLRIIFERIQGARMKLKPSKCHWNCSQVEFLGHKLTREGIRMNENKIKKIVELQLPKTKAQLQIVLGMFCYYRRFINGFAGIAQPMYDCLVGKEKFKLSDIPKKSFEELKKEFLKEVVLYYPDFEKAVAKGEDARPFHVVVDASLTGMGAVLCQKDQDNRMRPIYFASRRLTGAVKKYSSKELDVLAIYFACEKFEQFIGGVPSIVLSDNSAAVSIYSSRFSSNNARIDRWIARLKSKFDLTFKHIAGKINTVADFLSRYGHGNEEDFCELNNDPSEDKEEFRVGNIKICSLQSKFHGTLVEREVSVNYKRKCDSFPFQVDIRPVETRRQARKREESENELEADIQEMYDGIIDLDPEGKCPSFNEEEYGPPLDIVALGSNREHLMK
jgi:hypothetical protein